ncbi:MAG: hypothetical protein LBK68_00935 [Candidatus Margulisbacteria bacterium]|jgi:hypothetical protein|nr:hypothetical protein [Candidatus Margulisiibacteriota bacterium]
MKSDTIIKHEGLKVLNEYLGPVDMERFIVLLAREPFDYTKWHEDLKDDSSIREFSQKAMQYQAKQKA